MRTYILAIATAALFAIPTAAFSESGHHRYYNRYEGLYDRYESGRCRESRAACAHKEKLGEQVMGNCRRTLGSNVAARGLKIACGPAHSRQSDRRDNSAQCPNHGRLSAVSLG